MTPSDSDPSTSKPGAGKSRLQEQQLARLRAEAQAPYRGLRQFIYLACGGSALIGGFIFLTRLLAGDAIAEVLPNLALQVGVLALMITLFRLDQQQTRK